MQLILASAKIMHDKLKSVPDISLSKPRFLNEADAFARDMAQYSAETIAEMLGCSQQIAVQNNEGFAYESTLGEPDFPHFIKK